MTTAKQRNERLLKLADLLSNIALTQTELSQYVDKFDMGHFKCGTSACAAGYAALHPWFQERGLSMEHSSDLDWDRPAYGGLSGFFALEGFFGLSKAQADYLFGDDDDLTAVEEAAILRDFVARHPA